MALTLFLCSIVTLPKIGLSQLSLMEILNLVGHISAYRCNIVCSRLSVFNRHVLHLRHLCSQKYGLGYPYIAGSSCKESWRIF